MSLQPRRDRNERRCVLNGFTRHGRKQPATLLVIRCIPVRLPLGGPLASGACFRFTVQTESTLGDIHCQESGVFASSRGSWSIPLCRSCGRGVHDLSKRPVRYHWLESSGCLGRDRDLSPKGTVWTLFRGRLAESTRRLRPARRGIAPEACLQDGCPRSWRTTP